LVDRAFLAIVVAPVTALVIGLPGYGWYAKQVKPLSMAKDAVKQELTDPDSAVFRNERITTLGAVCGEVNSRNRMGGYGGFRHFQVSTFGGKQTVWMDDNDLHLAEQLCKGR
jgi:hypothetical protein